MSSVLDLRELRRVSVARSVDSWKMPLDAWSDDDWYNATAGEIGEAQNILKKLRRAEQGFAGNSAGTPDLLHQLAAELADAVIYLDLWCARFDLHFAGSHLSQPALLLEAPSPSRCIRWARQAQQNALLLHTGIEQAALPPAQNWVATEVLNALLMVAAFGNLDLPVAIVSAFNRKSEQLGFPDRLNLGAAEAQP